MSTQALPQWVRPFGQTHFPPAQLWPGPHLCPQRPQFLTSVLKWTHLFLQRLVFFGHWHLGFGGCLGCRPFLGLGCTQISPGGQHLVPHLTWCLRQRPRALAHASPGVVSRPPMSAAPPARNASRRDIPRARPRAITSSASSLAMCQLDPTPRRKYRRVRTDGRRRRASAQPAAPKAAGTSRLRASWHSLAVDDRVVGPVPAALDPAERCELRVHRVAKPTNDHQVLDCGHARFGVGIYVACVREVRLARRRRRLLLLGSGRDLAQRPDRRLDVGKLKLAEYPDRRGDHVLA